ncbi:YdiK family protein [Oceanobacillus sp. FSL K6-2867]|uniref:YdiK family protein n=1 Tax=Oceanobacillus sp. FSL K6-2867 TaxID=2954748 RepID=UPI0030DCB0E1
MINSLIVKAIIYLIMAIIFIYVAVQSKGETIWNPNTLIFAAVATLAFGVALRLLGKYLRIKKKK